MRYEADSCEDGLRHDTQDACERARRDGSRLRRRGVGRRRERNGHALHRLQVHPDGPPRRARAQGARREALRSGPSARVRRKGRVGPARRLREGDLSRGFREAEEGSSPGEVHGRYARAPAASRGEVRGRDREDARGERPQRRDMEGRAADVPRGDDRARDGGDHPLHDVRARRRRGVRHDSMRRRKRRGVPPRS